MIRNGIEKSDDIKGKIWKKGTALILALGLIGGLLGGCQRTSDGQSQTGAGMPGQGQAGFESGQADGQNGLSGAEHGKTGSFSEERAAMGRYVETQVELPKEAAAGSLIAFFRGEGRKLELYTSQWDVPGEIDEVYRFIREGDTWKEDAGWWKEKEGRLPFLALWHVIYGQDGRYYIGGVDEDYVYHLCRIDGDGAETELLPEVFEPKEGQTYGNNPNRVEVTADGNILIHSYKDASYYRPDGTKLFTMEKDWSGSTEYSIGFVESEEFVTRFDGQVVRYSLVNGQLKEKIPYAQMENEYGESAVLFGDKNGGIYIANEAGLSHVNAGGTLWELLIDGSLNTMGMRSVYMHGFLTGDERDSGDSSAAGRMQDYYGIYTGEFGEGILLYHYTFDVNTTSVPPMTLTVYGLSDNSTVRQAAAMFQKDHPEVRVEVLNAGLENGSVGEEIIRALNTELLSGNGADVLILDGLPAESYREKGILMDIREVFEEIQNETPIMEKVLRGFTEEDGAVFWMPARISVPLVIGEKNAIAAYGGLAKMRAYEGEKPLVAADTYENLLRQIGALQYKELFGNGIEGLTKPVLTEYLETVKALGTANGAKVLFSEQELENMWINNYTMSYGIRGSAIHYDMGLAESGVENIRGLFDLAIPAAIREKRSESDLKTVNGIYFPSVVTGVNQATKQPELAKEFIKYLFSTEVQREEFYDGFPLEKQAQKEQCAKEKENYMVGVGGDNYNISAEWPNLEERREMFEILEQLDTPVFVDETVMEMIVNGSKDYFNGKSTVDQAVSAISQQLMLYMAEQG